MNPELEHPLMFIKALDAPTKGRRGRGSFRRSNSRIRRQPPSIRGRSLEKENRTTRGRSSQTRQMVLGDLALSSDSEDGGRASPEERSRSLPSKFPADFNDFTPMTSAGSSMASTDRLLLDDLRLSSNSSSSSESSSEMTGPSDTESESSTDSIIAAQPLLGTLKGDAFFWIHVAPDPTVCEDFKSISLCEEPQLVIDKFKLVCRDHRIDRAGNMFADKLKNIPIKNCLKLLRIYHPLFKDQFFSTEMKSELIFGGFVMTLIKHWYAKEIYPVVVKLLKFLNACHIDPLIVQPFSKIEKDPLNRRVTSKEVDNTLLCCETYFACDDMKHCVKFLIRSLGNAIQKNNKTDLEHFLPLVKRIFYRLIHKRETRSLVILFTHILDTQENIEYPIELSLFYDGVLSVLAASSELNDHKLALDLFEKVNYWSCFEASGIACRSVLSVSAMINESPRRVARLYRTCVNAGIYPLNDPANWLITIYSSMTKIEIQVHLAQCLLGYLRRIWSGSLKMCATFLTFHVVVVSSAPVRDYVYPVHQKIREVDYSLAAGLRRLKSVMYHYMGVPVECFLQSCGDDKLVMFGRIVRELFKNVLRAKTLEKGQKDCILCRW